MTLFLIFCLPGCSQKAIYSAEGLTIYRVETEEGKELYADMSIFPAQLPKATKESLMAGEPHTADTVTLSDGDSYGYQGMENHMYIYILMGQWRILRRLFVWTYLQVVRQYIRKAIRISHYCTIMMDGAELFLSMELIRSHGKITIYRI